LGGRNSKVEYDSANRRNPESFQYGREVLEVVADEAETVPERLQVGLRRSHGDRIAIDPHELGSRRCREDKGGVSAPSQGGVDDDPAVFQRREEELDDLVGEYGSVPRLHRMSPLHNASMPSALAPSSPSQPFP
jgi:hypothetical protein